VAFGNNNAGRAAIAVTWPRVLAWPALLIYNSPLYAWNGELQAATPPISTQRNQSDY